MSWEYAGVIGVDAGLCWVGDPCYIMGEDATEHPCKTWSEFVNKLYPADSMSNDGDGHLTHKIDKLGFQQFNYKRGHAGLGVVVSTGYGDGEYPGFVKRGRDGIIAEVKVVFVPPEEQ
jgi:hypothetical protein